MHSLQKIQKLKVDEEDDNSDQIVEETMVIEEKITETGIHVRHAQK